ncbi:DUF998 domain-containing protein (plasmid) [Microvirga sp. VF16]|nr:DUF998 domain-containing protein [Microvirga sp. VF16]
MTASAFPGYSYAHNYISDLGVPDVGDFMGRFLNSPLHAVMNFGFIARGLLLLIGSLLILRPVSVARGRTPLLILALLHSVGIVLVGLVPSSPTSAAAGLIGVHTLGALLAILGGNTMALVAGLRGDPITTLRSYRIISIALGAFGGASFIMLMANISLARSILFADGIWERLSVYTIIAWTLVSSFAIFARDRSS